MSCTVQVFLALMSLEPVLIREYASPPLSPLALLSTWQRVGDRESGERMLLSPLALSP